MSRQRAMKKTERDPKAINRIGGAPIGIGKDNWPTIRNPNTDEMQPMIHVLTVETADLDIEISDDVAALALFVSSAEMPFYFSDPTADYEVVQLSQKDIERGELEGPELPESPLEATGLEILEKSPSSASFAGGKPRCIQSEGQQKGFVLQFDSQFIYLNLGDGGRLYMYDDWAFWDCY